VKGTLLIHTVKGAEQDPFTTFLPDFCLDFFGGERKVGTLWSAKKPREIPTRTDNPIARGRYMVEPSTSGAAGGLKDPRRIIVIYETPAAREHAIRSSHELAGTPCAEAGFEVEWWSFDSFSDAAFAGQAADKAAVSDLLIFAIVQGGDLAQDVKLWLEKWIWKRSEREGAVVGLVLLDPQSSPGELACLKEVYLRHAAHRAGMDYLSYVPPALVRTMPDSLDSYSQRAGQVTSVLDEILRGGLPPPSLP
jgi:hypothetical protein